MGWKDSIARLLHGDGDPGDPDEPVELVVVPLWRAPMLVEGLADRGVAAQFRETFNVVTKVASDAVVTVRRADLSAAAAALHELDSLEPIDPPGDDG